MVSTLPDMRDLRIAKYKRGGRSADEGLDCKSLFVEVMNRCGNDVRTPDIEVFAVERVAASLARGEYPYSEADAGLVAQELRSGKWQKIDAPEFGCAVLMALDPDKPALIQHLGVYIGGERFIHILEDMGVIVSRIDDRFFRRKIRGFYRWIG